MLKRSDFGKSVKVIKSSTLNKGLKDVDILQVCTFVNFNAEISNLEQATRGMIIIAVIFAFASLGASGIFGCHKFQTGKGALVAAGVYAFAGKPKC